VPALAFGSGTMLSKRGDVAKLVEEALKAGYRHIDTAEIYETENEVGQAIKNSGVKREDIFLTTKVFRKLKDPYESLNESLKRLSTDYVDQYLIHIPYPAEKQGTTIEEAWKGLERAYKEGKAKSIGVSNFRVEHLERILAIAEINPSVNQIEFSPYGQNQTPGIVEFSQSHGILIVAYGPMAPFHVKDGPLLPVLDELSQKYNKSPSQIVFRWVYQAKNILSVTSSANIDRINEALGSFDFTLDKEDTDRITAVGASHPFLRFPGNLQ